jgi:hypothetical protein
MRKVAPLWLMERGRVSELPLQPISGGGQGGHRNSTSLAAVKKKDSYLKAQFYRIKSRRGPKKAILAVVASILTAIYHMLKDGTMYKDLGYNHFDRRSIDQQKKRLVKRLADLSYAVEIKLLVSITR